MALPTWLAASTTVPAPVSVTVSPEIVAGPLFTLNVTGNEELATGGVTVTVAPLLKVWPGIVANGAIVWLAGAITKLRLTGVAALQLPSPDCEAVIVAVPPPRIVTILLDRLMLVEGEL